MTKRSLSAAVLVMLIPMALVAGEPVFGQIAEGRTSTAEDIGIVACYRMFTAPMLNEMCPQTPRPARLVVPHQPIRMVRGQWFPYSRIVVLAYDASGHLLAGIPIQIAVEDLEPPLLNLRADMIASDKVLPVRAGKFLIAVDTACARPGRPDDRVEIIAEAEVVEP